MAFKGMLFPEADPRWWKNIEKNEERQSEEIKYDDVQETERSFKHQKMSVYPNRAVGSSARRRG